MSLFEGKLVRLTHIRRDDIPTFCRWFRDYEVQRLLAFDPIIPITDEAEEAWFESAAKSENEYHFSIRLLENDLLIGNCSLFGVNARNRSAEFGIAIGEKEYWGRGFGSDAMRVLLRFAFNELNLNRVHLDVLAYNKRAISAYVKVGFTHEGTRRCAIYREGEYHDVYVMAILHEEWKAHQE
jgi:RimJ/RimL family protein N-acetyltransferase